jgi:hypothetical protein
MDLRAILQHLFPSAAVGSDYTLRDDGDGPYIDAWNLPEPQPSPEDLAVAWPLVELERQKAITREVMKAACSAAIQAGIVCNALGADHEYPTTLTDQQNLAATVLAAQVNGAAGEPYKFWCADSGGAWARRPHTAAQILAVGEAVRAHVVAQQEHYEQKLIEIDQATAETISTITW